ncbi:hypothetical protein [Comamonas sp. 4034]|uniref:hypothetical protein n=1 Tax=Comamonas sp. 4034 TaxID=3156455 RepID=UPI003D1D273F
MEHSTREVWSRTLLIQESELDVVAEKTEMAGAADAEVAELGMLRKVEDERQEALDALGRKLPWG